MTYHIDKELEPEYLRYLIARDKTTVPELLDALRNDQNWVVRKEVGANPNTPIETLEKMWKEENLYVREAIAGNPNTPLNILKELMKDGFGRVRTAANETLSGYTKDVEVMTYEVGKRVFSLSYQNWGTILPKEGPIMLWPILVEFDLLPNEKVKKTQVFTEDGKLFNYMAIRDLYSEEVRIVGKETK